MASFIALCLIILSFSCISFGKFYLTPLYLRKLAIKEEENIVNIFKVLYKNSSDKSLNYAHQRYMEDYMESSGILHGTLENKVDQILSHPFLSFRMIYRAVTYYPTIQDVMNETLKDAEESWLDIPKVEDLEEALDSILRLSFVYDLQLTEFVSGTIQNIETKFGLNWRHCLEIGKRALRTKYYALAVEWLEITEYLRSKENAGETTNTDINGLLLEAVKTHDFEFDHADEYPNKFFVKKIAPNAGFPYEYDGLIHHRIKQRTHLERQYAENTGKDFNEVRFWSLCSKSTLLSEEEKKHLKCLLKTNSNKYWLINPLKVEELSLIPRILQIYDILPDSVIKSIISTAESLLEPSLICVEKKSEKSADRTSYTAFLFEDKFKQSNYIKRVVETITGLNVVKKGSSELLQVAAYTFGGHYNFHVDALDASKSIETGDRFATFMIYLSDVEAGGFTAFTNARVAATPIKGSAVFWFNLYDDGDVDFSTYHGGCPLLLGRPKWIANQWIYYNSQFNVEEHLIKLCFTQLLNFLIPLLSLDFEFGVCGWWVGGGHWMDIYITFTAFGGGLNFGGIKLKPIQPKILNFLNKIKHKNNVHEKKFGNSMEYR